MWSPQGGTDAGLNIPVFDLQRSIDFFAALGFTFNTPCTDATATCMFVGEDADFVLLPRHTFGDFARRSAGDAHNETTASM
jgi:predicted lactoylglutathione lyase